MMANDVRLYVDRTTRQWVVLDPDGRFWTLPATGIPWNDRQPFEVADETELESVPGHYKSILGIPRHVTRDDPRTCAIGRVA
jgi:hypothetical protein